LVILEKALERIIFRMIFASIDCLMPLPSLLPYWEFWYVHHSFV
jgi:hypothetical protein